MNKSEKVYKKVKVLIYFTSLYSIHSFTGNLNRIHTFWNSQTGIVKGIFVWILDWKSFLSAQWINCDKSSSFSMISRKLWLHFVRGPAIKRSFHFVIFKSKVRNRKTKNLHVIYRVRNATSSLQNRFEKVHFVQKDTTKLYLLSMNWNQMRCCNWYIRCRF